MNIPEQLIEAAEMLAGADTSYCALIKANDEVDVYAIPAIGGRVMGQYSIVFTPKGRIPRTDPGIGVENI